MSDSVWTRLAGDEIKDMGSAEGPPLRFIGYSLSLGVDLAVDVTTGDLYDAETRQPLAAYVHLVPGMPEGGSPGDEAWTEWARVFRGGAVARASRPRPGGPLGAEIARMTERRKPRPSHSRA